MAEEQEQRGKLDAVSIAYVIGGIPTMAFFFVILFFFAHACDIPA